MAMDAIAIHHVGLTRTAGIFSDMTCVLRATQQGCATGPVRTTRAIMESARRVPMAKAREVTRLEIPVVPVG
jgi:hypothetical protein